MKFWDSSAIVPLLVEEQSTKSLLEIKRQDPEVLVWWATEVESASAIARLEREGGLASGDVEAALARLVILARSWNEIQPIDEIRELAVRFLRIHPLRAGDALQLAAAYVASEKRPRTLELVCLDGRLTRAAAREGFRIVAS